MLCQRVDQESCGTVHSDFATCYNSENHDKNMGYLTAQIYFLCVGYVVLLQKPVCTDHGDRRNLSLYQK
jgi:hypothetical protein